MSKFFSIVLIIFSAVLLILASGCSDRGTVGPDEGLENLLGEWGPTPATSPFRTSFATQSESPQFLFQLRNPDALLEMELIVPREAWVAPVGGGQRVPLLVLLAPEDGDELFYRNHGLFELATQMVAEGEIQPMMILTIANDPTFGGYFYGSSYGAGFYDDIIADTTDRGLMANIYNKLDDLLLDSPSKLGIGGFGQGAYGAFRHILKHPGVFNSIAVADGPLAFEDAQSSWQTLFDLTVAEQEVRWLSKSTAGVPNTMPFEIEFFDSTNTMALSRMFIGGSLAFSPDDTLIDFTMWQTSINQPDSATVDAKFSWADTLRPASMISLASNLIKPSTGDWDFHLPFSIDSTSAGSGVLNQEIWDRWIENDLKTLWADANADAGGEVLSNVNIWIGTSTQAKWGYNAMTEAWISSLGSNVDATYRYQGYAGNPATDNQYVYDLLREMLKFHSDNFGSDDVHTLQK